MTEHLVDALLQPDGRIFVQPYSRTEIGHWVIDGFPDVADSSEDFLAVGQTALTALTRSNARVLPETAMQDPQTLADLLEWAGKRSWSAYVKGVRMVSLKANYDDAPHAIDVRPQQKHSRGGFTGIEGTSFTITYESPEQLGHAILQGFEKAI